MGCPSVWRRGGTRETCVCQEEQKKGTVIFSISGRRWKSLNDLDDIEFGAMDHMFFPPIPVVEVLKWSGTWVYLCICLSVYLIEIWSYDLAERLSCKTSQTHLMVKVIGGQTNIMVKKAPCDSCQNMLDVNQHCYDLMPQWHDDGTWCHSVTS